MSVTQSQSKTTMQVSAGSPRGQWQSRRIPVVPIRVSMPKSVPLAAEGYTCCPGQLIGEEGLSADNLVKEGFTYVAWDGMTTHPLVDGRRNHIIGVLIGRSEHKVELERSQLNELTHKIREAGARLRNVKRWASYKTPKRGNHSAEHDGFLHGNGRTKAKNFTNVTAVSEVMEEMRDNPALKAIDRRTKANFQKWNPNICVLYMRTMAHFESRHRALKRPFHNSPFPAMTVNFGPRTVTKRHRDESSLMFGLCGITALGNFNPDEGGHLILWELCLVIWFLPGLIVLIPLSLIQHSNTPLDSGECFSFVQYSAGALFRWAEHGFQTEKKYKASLGDPDLVQQCAYRRA